MLNKITLNIINFFTKKLAIIGWSELNRLRICGKADPAYLETHFMSNDEYIKHIKSLPFKLAVITTAFFILKKVERKIING